MTSSSSSSSSPTTNNKAPERIYIGGLDPSRGLTVELVAQRLCLVKGVNILSINDHHHHAGDNESKRARIVDEDGDLVDTRNFFYVEARPTSSSSKIPSAAMPTTNTNTGVDGTSSSAPPSALELLAKQYHHVKWKGCLLRVEAAKPHFLKRLEEERADRERRNTAIASAAAAALEKTEISNGGDGTITKEEGDNEGNDDKVVKKCRRRLRIRKRFGEEAYNVDTHPHPLHILSSHHDPNPDNNNNNNDGNNDDECGWEQFATLHKRMQTKRESQQIKLMEKRKKERRLWASGKKSSTGSEGGGSSSNNIDELNSLIFLNRGIHIRFEEDEFVTLDHQEGESENGSESGGGRGKTAMREEAAGVAVDKVEPGDESVSSSSVVSTSSDSEESSEYDGGEGKADNNGNKEGYVWSDDDEEDENELDGDDGQHSTSDVSTEEEEEESSVNEKNSQVDGGKYAWSDDEADEVGREKEWKDGSTTLPKVTKKKMTIDGSAYTKAVAIDEFSGGMDFDTTFDASEAHHDGADEDDDFANEDDQDDGASQCPSLEGDIRSNIDILSSMFPKERFEAHPLVASINAAAGDSSHGGGNNKGSAGNGGSEHQQQLGKAQNSSSMFGTGLIMQRYDPTKEADKRFEVSQQQVVGDKDDKEDKDIDSSNPLPLQEETDKDDNSNNGSSSKRGDDSESVSSESSEDDDDGSVQQHATKHEDTNGSEKKSRTSATNNVKGNIIAPAKDDVYEQDKLENIFKEARRDGSKTESSSFSLANLFEKEDIRAQGSNNNEDDAKKAPAGHVGGGGDGDVYEQDKLEDVFKQARQQGNTNSSAVGSSRTGFSFGFQSQLPEDDTKADGGSALFSFGFDLSKKVSNNENDLATTTGHEHKSDKKFVNNETKLSDVVQDTATATTTSAVPRQIRRIRRVGMTFPNSVLDKYETLFFNLNEGSQIIHDLDGMKHHPENQEQWQKERQVLTADWKRKQKAALSRKKVKKVRRM